MYDLRMSEKIYFLYIKQKKTSLGTPSQQLNTVLIFYIFLFSD